MSHRNKIAIATHNIIYAWEYRQMYNMQNRNHENGPEKINQLYEKVSMLTLPSLRQ